MIIYTKRLGYRYESVPGSSGEHHTNINSANKITIGKDNSLENRVIIFSHELGHALDFVHTPVTIEESTDSMNNKITSGRVVREVSAWEYGEQLLKDMNCYKYVQGRFVERKQSALLGYRNVAISN